MHYVDLTPPDWAVQHVDACTLPPGATWGQVWEAGLCKDRSVALANCRFDYLAKRPVDPACKDVLAPKPPP